MIHCYLHESDDDEKWVGDRSIDESQALTEEM
jgi:hypothetical protein